MKRYHQVMGKEVSFRAFLPFIEMTVCHSWEGEEGIILKGEILTFLHIFPDQKKGKVLPRESDRERERQIA